VPDSETATPTLEVQGLTAGYGPIPIIENLTCMARKGQITAIVGPNGAGKSTLLKAIMGAITVVSGRVLLDGESVSGLAPEQVVRRGVAYVPQVANVFPSLSIRENLEMGGYIRRHGRLERIDEIYAMFPALKLASHRAAGTLSGGQRNMLAMARGLMVDPAVLLLDEPTAGLAPTLVTTVWDHVLQVRASGLAVLIVEQNTRRTLQYADWAYVLTEGKNRIEGSGADLLDNEEVVRLYVGQAQISA
jgi:ABC-type branched-subunit amino acid transport system ATPase component